MRRCAAGETHPPHESRHGQARLCRRLLIVQEALRASELRRGNVSEHAATGRAVPARTSAASSRLAAASSFLLGGLSSRFPPRAGGSILSGGRDNVCEFGGQARRFGPPHPRAACPTAAHTIIRTPVGLSRRTVVLYRAYGRNGNSHAPSGSPQSVARGPPPLLSSEARSEAAARVLLSALSGFSLSRLFHAAGRGMATPSASALQRLAATAARIFGNVIGTGERSGRKWLERPLIGERVATYYPTSISATDPLYEDPLEKRCAARLRRRRRPPPLLAPLTLCSCADEK